MAKLDFDATNISPQTAFEPLPAGWYQVAITASENKPTKDNSGAYLQLELTVTDGPMKGRKVFDRLNLWNPNQTAVEIAYRTLSAICHATGKIQVGDSTELHNVLLEAKVALRPASAGYEASNDIKGYRAYGSGDVAPTAPAAPVAPAAPAATPVAPSAPAQAPATPVAQPTAPAAPAQPAAPVATAPAAPAATAPATNPPAAAPTTAPAAFPWAAPVAQ